MQESDKSQAQQCIFTFLSVPYNVAYVKSDPNESGANKREPCEVATVPQGDVSSPQQFQPSVQWQLFLTATFPYRNNPSLQN